jgi:hypothetical protein
VSKIKKAAGSEVGVILALLRHTNGKNDFLREITLHFYTLLFSSIIEREGEACINKKKGRIDVKNVKTF